MSMQTIRGALDNAARIIAENPDKARVKNAYATASLQDGLKFSVTGPSGERLATDMPKGVGGDAGAPTPGWLMRASLAACTGTVIAMRAARLGIALTHLDVTVDCYSDQRGMLGLDEAASAKLSAFHLRVAIGAEMATPAALEDLVRWSDAHSPVACTMREALGADIEVVVV